MIEKIENGCQDNGYDEDFCDINAACHRSTPIFSLRLL